MSGERPAPVPRGTRTDLEIVVRAADQEQGPGPGGAPVMATLGPNDQLVVLLDPELEYEAARSLGEALRSVLERPTAGDRVVVVGADVRAMLVVPRARAHVREGDPIGSAEDVNPAIPCDAPHVEPTALSCPECGLPMREHTADGCP